MAASVTDKLSLCTINAKGSFCEHCCVVLVHVFDPASQAEDEKVALGDRQVSMMKRVNAYSLLFSAMEFLQMLFPDLHIFPRFALIGKFY